MGLLNDLIINDNTNVASVQLCIVRAEEFRMNAINNGIEISSITPVMIKDLPLGPLDTLEFYEDDNLDTYLNNPVIYFCCLM